jgi:8-oxo-dGTP pyrophosphatase MutT (NUDIX family)
VSLTVERSAARVLLVDAAGRLLLLRWMHATAPERGSWWITPGGGLDPDEDATDGAARELFEETGLRLTAADLIGPVFERDTDTEIDGTRYLQHEVFYVGRVDAHEVDTCGFTDLEVASITDHRWWTQAELEATDERLSPRELPSLLRDLGC